jgi:hypothetical protein
MPMSPLYVCTIKKSKIVKGKAKMVITQAQNKLIHVYFTTYGGFSNIFFIHMYYFSKIFTENHILSNIKLPAEIKVFSTSRQMSTVKMVMSKSKVKGKAKGGAMITTNWMHAMKNCEMKVEDICMFWFIVSRDGRKLTLLVDHVRYQ